MGNHTVIDDFFVVDLDDMEVMLDVQWMETLDEYTSSFKQMELSFKVDDNEVVLRGMSNGGPKEILAQWMNTIFWHDDIVWAALCFISIEPIKGQQSYCQDDELQAVLDKHGIVIVDILLGIPSHMGFEHTIKLVGGAKPIITTPYRHLKIFKDEIEKTIQELLDKRWIKPN